MSDGNKITYFGLTDFRNERKRFGIKNKDRARHVYVIGKTGMGKSTLLENMAVQDIQGGEGMCFIDPHGSAIEVLLEYIPEHRIKDVVYFAPFDSEHPIAFNVMEDIDPDKRYLVASGLMSTFKKIWVDAWSARMEYILNNTLLALLEYPDSTLLSVNRMLSDKGFRDEIVRNVTDPGVRAFWVDEFANYTERMQAESVPAIQNKIGQFTANPVIRNIIGQTKSSFNVREMMDNKKIFLVNLSKGQIGEQNAALLGGMIITAIYLGAMSRADVPKYELAKLPDFYLFVDEFQNFANESFADILSEARKYKLALTVAHQYVAQMEEEVADAVFGNVGTTIAYRVGPMDAETLEKMFSPTFIQEDIVSLGRFQFYLSLMIDEVGSRPFSATGMPPLPKPEISYRREVIDSSREIFAKPRQEVEEFIAGWHGQQFETNRQQKQNDKREKKFGDAYRGPSSQGGTSSFSQNASVPKEEPPARIIISEEIKQSIQQKDTPVIPPALSAPSAPPTSPISRVVIPDLPKSKPQPPVEPKKEAHKEPVKVFKPKTVPTPPIPQGVKEFIQSVDEVKTSEKQSGSQFHFSKKEASEQNKNTLKEALAKALKQSGGLPEVKKQEVPVQKKVEEPKVPVVQRPKKDHASLRDLVRQAEEVLEKHHTVGSFDDFDTRIHHEPVSSGIKEVPEDVLRSILD
jgi:hypothetical protein